MKKLIIAVLFVAALFSTDTLIAQNKIEVNAAASEKTKALSTHIKFTDEDQKEEVYLAFKEFYATNANLKNAKSADPLTVKKVKDRLENKLKSILNEEQFETYTSLLKQNQ